MKLCKLDLHYTLEMENVPPFLCNITEFVPELIYKNTIDIKIETYMCSKNYMKSNLDFNFDLLTSKILISFAVFTV